VEVIVPPAARLQPRLGDDDEVVPAAGQDADMVVVDANRVGVREEVEDGRRRGTRRRR
jgi:hypothetical protein